MAEDGGGMQIPEFYQAFAPACFALLGLWFVVVQIRDNEWRQKEWKKHPEAKWRAYGVALNFALPGVMSLLALVDLNTHTFWQVSFAVIGFGGALAIFVVFLFHVRVRRLRLRDPVGWAACALIGLYVAIGALAIVGGANALRTVAVLLTIVLFLGFNVGWLLMIEELSPDPNGSAPTEKREERDPASLS
jgi:hypothetical protein